IRIATRSLLAVEDSELLRYQCRAAEISLRSNRRRAALPLPDELPARHRVRRSIANGVLEKDPPTRETILRRGRSWSWEWSLPTLRLQIAYRCERNPHVDRLRL